MPLRHNVRRYENRLHDDDPAVAIDARSRILDRGRRRLLAIAATFLVVGLVAFNRVGL